MARPKNKLKPASAHPAAVADDESFNFAMVDPADSPVEVTLAQVGEKTSVVFSWKNGGEALSRDRLVRALMNLSRYFLDFGADEPISMETISKRTGVPRKPVERRSEEPC